MFGDFCFPDGTKPEWSSLSWLQQEFMTWFNAERLKTIITFPVESFALVYKDGKFIDPESAKFVAEEYARGHSFLLILVIVLIVSHLAVVWKTWFKQKNLILLMAIWEFKLEVKVLLH